MRFCVERYLQDRPVAMHCSTRDEAIVFTKHLHDLGFEWCDGDSLATVDAFSMHGDNGAYCFGNTRKLVSLTTMYAAIDYDYEILEFSDFDWNDEDDDPIEVSEEYFQFISELMGVS